MSPDELQRLARRIAGGDAAAARRALAILGGRREPGTRLLLSGFLGHEDDDGRFHAAATDPWTPDHSRRVKLGPYLRVRLDAHPGRSDRIGGYFAKVEALVRDEEGDDEERWGDAMDPGDEDEPGTSWRPIAWLEPHGWRTYVSGDFYLRVQVVEE